MAAIGMLFFSSPGCKWVATCIIIKSSGVCCSKSLYSVMTAKNCWYVHPENWDQRTYSRMCPDARMIVEGFNKLLWSVENTSGMLSFWVFIFRLISS